MFLKKLFDSIGHFFVGLFNQAEKAWLSASPAFQKALLAGSTIVAFINNYVDETPEFILEAIQRKFPDMTPENIHAALQKAGSTLAIAEKIAGADLVTTIKAFQEWLLSLKSDNNTWSEVSHAIALGIAVFFAPQGTKITAIIVLFEYVYHALVKDQFQVLPGATVVPVN
jgi:hypothetical protein